MVREGTVTRTETPHSNEQGFSLVELVIAMTVTMIISGAVFQLMTASQNAFRKEPAVADRQQNIRMAIDLISQDVFGAGFGLPPFAQAFRDNLDGVGPTGSGGAATDEIELVASSDCGYVQVCDLNGTQLTTFETLQECYNLPSMVILANDDEWYPYWAEDPGAGSTGSCSSGPGDKNGHVVINQGVPLNKPGPSKSFTNPPQYMIVGKLVRYRINPGPDGTPNLERSDYGGEDYPGGDTSWEVIATGVEDLQVEYLNGVDWQDTPGTVSCGTACAAPGQAEYDTLIRRVRVRLSARALAANVTGQTTDATGSDAVRGQLETEIAPRAAVTSLGQGSGEL
jgi:type II secretory pathway pseudopilin PulG